MKQVIRCGLLLLFTFCLLEATQRIAVVSIPKSGTHLAKKCINLLSGKSPVFFLTTDLEKMDWSGQFLWAHIKPVPKNIHTFSKYSIQGIWMVRDPRDQITSFAWNLKKNFARVRRKSIEAIIMQLIINTGNFIPSVTGGQACLAYTNVLVWYDHYLPWQDYPFIYVAHFEKLVGSKGGGSLEDQIAEISGIALHVGLEKSDEEIMSVAQNLFGGTSTFNKGQIGSWKEFFSEEHKEAFKAIAGQLLIDLGYESGFDW